MSQTTRLKLFKHDNPSTNTNQFNVTTALNENWDKIDNEFGDTIKGFNSIADMIADSKLQAGDVCQTLGYYLINDGGASLYKIRTKTNNDVIDNMIKFQTSSNELLAELIVEYPINPKKLGAYGDGVHDDRVPLQKAIDLGDVILTKGSYYISQSLEIKSNRIFDGGNQFLIPASEQPAFKGIGTTSNPIVETYIKNVQIKTTDLGGYGIYLENGYFNYFDNINIIKLKGTNAYGFKFVNGFNQVVSNSRVYGDYQNYSGQIGINISTTSGYMSNETNNKYDTLLLQNIDYGVKANYSITANMIQFNNIGFSSCKYCFYMEGTALPISIDNTRMEGAERNDSEELYGFYLKGGIRPTINTFNAYNINNVIHTELSMLTLIGNITLTGTNQTPKYNFFSSSSTGKVMNLATLYSLGAVYDGSTPTTLYLTNSKDIEDGTNNTSTLNAYQSFNRIVKQTSQYIAYVRGKKGSIVYAWTDENNLVIRGKTNKPDTTNQFDADVNMVKGKMYKFYLIDDDMSVILN